MAVYGADADELDRLAAAFRQAADELDNEGGLMTRLLNNVSWIGDVAGSFLGSWSGVQLPRIGLSTRFLREAADDLTRNATEQRQESAASTGAIGAIVVPTSQEAGADAWELFEARLEVLGVSREAIEAIMKGLRAAGSDHVDALLETLLQPGLVAFIEVLDTALDIVDFIVDFGKDFADHPHLAPEDRIVHALIDAGVGLATSKGVEVAVHAIMTLVGSLLPLPGAGTVAGAVLGKVLGLALGELAEIGTDKLDEHFDIKDSIADAGVDMLNRLDDLQEIPGQIIGDAIEAGSDLVSAGAETVSDFVDWIF